MNNVKKFVKRHLGGTFLWRWLQGARRSWERTVRSSGWKKALYAVLPERMICRLSQTADFYGCRYFDEAKDPSQESGYGAVYSDQQEFREVAARVEELFRPERVLDIGCARGFQVRALEERGIEAWGIDISEYAVRTAPAEIAHRLRVCGCQHTPFPDGWFDTVLLMETLEHIPLYDIDRCVGEARRVGSRWIWATIPSIGANPYGPDGITGGKVLERYIPMYEEGEIDLAPFSHLVLDVHGVPIHGHLIVASCDWWTETFTRHGLVRRGDLERKVNAEISNAREGVWNCYVLARASDPAGVTTLAMPSEWEWERTGEGRWRSGTFLLPPGIHRVECVLGVIDRSEEGNRLHRALSVKCVSWNGEAVLGLRTFNGKSVPHAEKGGGVNVSLPCACEETRKARLEVEFGPGFHAVPMHPGRIVLHATAAKAKVSAA